MRSVLALRQLHEGVVRVSRATLASPQPPSAPLAPPRPFAAARRARAAPLAAAAAAAAAGGAPCAGCFTGCGAPSLGWSANFAARYTVGGELGRGSFGVVRVATAKDTGRQVAVKVLPKFPGGSPAPSPAGSPAGSADAGPHCTGAAAAAAQLQAIGREAETWAALQASQFVARLEGLYEDDENAYLVSELCGATVRGLLDERGGRLDEADAAVVMRGVLDVLVESHQRGVAYGDVKPANFLITADPDAPRGVSVRAVDFGCSRPVPLTTASGTPLYLAPELGVARRCGVAVDVWACGVMLYELLSGRLPFWANLTPQQAARLRPWEIVAATRTHEVSYPRAQWAGVSAEGRALVEAMLSRDPAARITAADALAHPWFRAVLGFTPTPSGAAAAAAAAAPAAVAACA